MKTSELVKILKSHGVDFIEHGASHDKYYSQLSKKIVIVPRNRKEIATGTANAILKQAGIK